MKIYMINCEIKYEVENICRLFFPYCRFEFCESHNPPADNNYFMCINLDKFNYNDIIINVFINNNGEIIQKTSNFSCVEVGKHDLELRVSSLIFGILSDCTHIHPKWGIITGVRPVKLFRSILQQKGTEYSKKYFQNKLHVSDEKINLVSEVCKIEEKILSLSKHNSFSLYVSIPFCPSRCSYCSFVSHSVEKSAKLVPVYIDLLIKEIEYTAKIVKDLNLRLETVYIGGGTPTVLTIEQMTLLVDTINRNFDMATCREFTIESGRPDTLNLEKIKMLSTISKIRISINPQTFNNDVLNNIGRKHTDKDVIYAFKSARELGINNINMDLIAGLPGDSFESFCNTISETVNLSPESITLHTLSIKRAANMSHYNGDIHNQGQLVDNMINYAYESFTKFEYKPYYLYRQSKMVCNAENTGWAKQKFDGLYNVYIMDETHSVIACGAGSVTKLKDPFSPNIQRIFNFKFVYEYVSRFKEIIYRKGKVKSFYEKL